MIISTIISEKWTITSSTGFTISTKIHMLKKCGCKESMIILRYSGYTSRQVTWAITTTSQLCSSASITIRTTTTITINIITRMLIKLSTDFSMFTKATSQSSDLFIYSIIIQHIYITSYHHHRTICQ